MSAQTGPGRSHAAADAATVQATLAALVIKDGVLLGGLAAQPQAVALGLAWCALPGEASLREADVNVALKRCLADEGSFLDVDHVELRRWLVDSGWLVRDGFGRQYQRVSPADLPADSAPIAAALVSLDTPRWVGGIRAAEAQQRTARRQAWEARQAVVGKARP